MGEKHFSLLMEFNAYYFDRDTLESVFLHFDKLLAEFLDKPNSLLIDSHFYTEQDLFQKLDLNSQEYERILPFSQVQKALFLNQLIYPQDTKSKQAGLSVDIFGKVDRLLWKRAFDLCVKYFSS